jgi:hypothetical protein
MKRDIQYEKIKILFNELLLLLVEKMVGVVNSENLKF